MAVYIDSETSMQICNKYLASQPFSHVSEQILEKHARNQTDIGETREKIHEQITVDIIQTDADIKRILNKDERNFVVKLIENNTISQ